MSFEEEGNYCTCSPDGFLGIWKWNVCCFHHDRQYRNEVVNRKTRKEADIDLRNCIKRHLPLYLKWIAYIYYAFIRTFGWRFWVK